MSLKPLPFTLVLILSATSSLHAYDIEQFIKDTQKNPDGIYKNLHPEARAFVDRGIELYQTSEAFREEKFIDFEKDPAKMKPAKIWSFIWQDFGYGDYYGDGYKLINTFDEGEWRYITVQELGYPEEVKMIDTFVFRKSSEDDYLFYPPGWIMDYYTPVDYLEPSDDLVNNAMFELFLKQRIEENITEEDKEAFKNAKSPADVSELMQKIMSRNPENNSTDND